MAPRLVLSRKTISIWGIWVVLKLMIKTSKLRIYTKVLSCNTSRQKMTIWSYWCPLFSTKFSKNKAILRISSSLTKRIFWSTSWIFSTKIVLSGISLNSNVLVWCRIYSKLRSLKRSRSLTWDLKSSKAEFKIISMRPKQSYL